MLRASLTPALQEASDALHAHSAELARGLLVKALLVRGMLARVELEGRAALERMPA